MSKENKEQILRPGRHAQWPGYQRFSASTYLCSKYLLNTWYVLHSPLNLRFITEQSRQRHSPTWNLYDSGKRQTTHNKHNKEARQHIKLVRAVNERMHRQNKRGWMWVPRGIGVSSKGILGGGLGYGSTKYDKNHGSKALWQKQLGLPSKQVTLLLQLSDFAFLMNFSQVLESKRSYEYLCENRGRP